MKPPRPKPLISRRPYRGCSPYRANIVRVAMPWEIRRYYREQYERNQRAQEQFIAQLQRAHIAAVEACTNPDCPVHHPKDVSAPGVGRMQ